MPELECTVPANVPSINSHTTLSINLANSRRKIFITTQITNIFGQPIFKIAPCIDTGSFLNLISLKTFVSQNGNLEILQKCNVTVTGIQNCPIPVIGTFSGTVRIKYGFFKNVLFHVIDTEIPPIFGLNFLDHETVESYEISRNFINFFRKINNVKFQNTVEIENPKNIETIFHTSNFRKSPVFSEKVQEAISVLGVKISENANPEHSEKVASLLLQYKKVFGVSSENSKIGNFPVSVPIDTVGKSIYVKPMPIPRAYKNEVESELKKMLEMGVIEKCDNSRGWNSPILCVPKQDKSVRICVNFKNTLNCRLAEDTDKYTLPVSENLFQEMGTENKFFGCLDLAKGYWQIKIDEKDHHKTCFTFENTVYAFTRLPFGLKNADDLFCHAITSVLKEVKNISNIKSYVDDILLHSESFEVYFETLKQVLDALDKYDLRLNGQKCEFLKTEVKFLGRILRQDGFSADPEYVQGIKDLTPPKTKRELLIIIGRFVWIKDFICSKVAEFAFSHLLKELTKLNKKSEKFHWPDSAQKSFELAKSRLSSEKIIYFADFSKPFYLVTDASGYAVAGILMQNFDGKQRIIAAVSKTLSETEQRWSASERECYAIVFCVERLHYFLKGTSFVLLTDHKALTYLDLSILKTQK